MVWNEHKSRKLSLGEGSPDPYMGAALTARPLSAKYTTADWVYNLIGAWQQDYSRTFLLAR